MPSTQTALINANSNTKIKVNVENNKVSPSNPIIVETSHQQQDIVNSNDKQHVNSTGNKTPQEQPEFIKQALIIIEKKVRNLEKRRIKLDEYKSNQKKGEKLNEDQLNAVSKYDEVIRTLELTRELEKQFVGLANDALKQQKKQAKKEQIERDEAIKDKLKEAYKFISFLNKFNQQNVRHDFLTETNRAEKLSENELNMIDDFNNLIKPCELGDRFDQSTSEVADHLISLVDGKNKPVSQLNNVTYQDLRKLFDRIISSSYWSLKLEPEEPVAKTALNESTSTANPENKEMQFQTKEQVVERDGHNLENRVIEQITSEDFILVSTTSNPQILSNDSISDNFQKNNMVQSQQKTFFTTLNPADLSTNFLNEKGLSSNEEGLNFLQDSEVQIVQNEPESYQNSIQNSENNEISFKQQRSGNRDHASSRGYQKPRFNDDRRNGANPAQRGGQGFNNNRNQINGNSNFRSNNQNRSEHRNNYYRGSSNNNNNNGFGRSSNQRTGGYRNQEQFQQMIVQN